jgi:serine/threonine-protein kinase
MNPDTDSLARALANSSRAEREAYYASHQVPEALRSEVESVLQSEDVTLPEPARPRPETGRGPHPISIGRYQVVRLIGRGGMGDVYLARDPVLDRDVAVKLISEDVDTPRSRQRLVQEARAAGRLQHPNIVTVFDAGEHEDQPFIAMEYVRGETLGRLIRRRAPMALARRLELIEHACAGLAHAHRAGVVHLDIKPDNLMLDESGVVKVLDFGIARVLKTDLLVTRQLGGTLRYMSPEQVDNRPLDRRSDVFSLGCALFELIAFVPAFVGSTKDIVTQISIGPVPGLLEALPGLEPRLDAITRRAMALDPAERYADLDELRAELAAVRRSLDPAYDPRFKPPGSIDEDIDGAATRPVSIGKGAVSSAAGKRLLGQRRRGLIGAALLITALVGASVFWMLRPREGAPAGANAQTSPGPTAVDERPVAVVPPPEPPPESLPAPPPESDATPRTVARDPVSRAAAPRAEPERSPVVTPPAAEEPVQPRQPPPIPVDAPAAPASVPVAATPAPPAPAAAPIAEPPPARSRLDHDAVSDALRQYEAAYRALDVNSLLQVYPSLAGDQAEQLRRTFASVTEYEVEIRNPEIEVQVDTAVVRAAVARRLTPRVGNPIANEIQTEFRLRRKGSAWQIAAVSAR